MRHLALLAVGYLFFMTHSVEAKEVKIHGFVTAVNSPSNFEIDDYKITRDQQLVLEIDKDEANEGVATFDPKDIRVGTELEIKGDWDETTGELKAKSIKVFLDDTRKIKRTALVQEAPNLKKSDAGYWTGFIKTDGQRVAISEATNVSTNLNSSERKQKKAIPNSDQPDASSKLLSTDYVTRDTFVHYEGITPSRRFYFGVQSRI